MKATYIKPLIKTEDAQPTNIICGSIEVVSNNAGIEYESGSSEEARVRECEWDFWGDE